MKNKQWIYFVEQSKTVKKFVCPICTQFHSSSAEDMLFTP